MIYGAIEQYCIVYRADIDITGLEKSVDILLKDGWALFGSPFFSDDFICQPMVKVKLAF